ncbi:MAG: hypothetical protein COC13_03740 [Methanobacteriota archaeon]|nr:MAG: hypothetical protein COC13_03740 [Euryarchaeota archaeon]
MDLTEKFLPSEKLLKKYENITVDNKRNGSLFLTNLRVFVGNQFNLWDIPCENIDYLERGFVPRFSAWWQLLFIPLSLIFVRAVFHLHITDEDLEKAIDAFKHVQ